MNKVTSSYVKGHLGNAMKQLNGSKMEKIWEHPIEKANGDEWYLDGLEAHPQHTGKILKLIPPIAACFLVCFLSYFVLTMRPEVTICFDVNPSVELQINRNEKILSAMANNSDGEIILEDMDLKGIDLDVAINAILGSMAKHGYLTEEQNTVLVSVDSRNPDKTSTLQARLADEVETCLTSLCGSGSVYVQMFHTSDELEELAAEDNITPGKAALIQKIIKEHDSFAHSELAVLPMEALIEYLENNGMDIDDFIDEFETDDESSGSSDIVSGNSPSLNKDTAHTREPVVNEWEDFEGDGQSSSNQDESKDDDSDGLDDDMDDDVNSRDSGEGINE